MTELEYKNLKKISYIANTVIMLCVLGLFWVFLYFKVDYMVYHSIPTFIAYLFFYILISKEHFKTFLWSVYFLITIYMSAATICLGISFGFNLYCMSLLPILFLIDYFAHKMDSVKSSSLKISILIVIAFLGSTGFSQIHGPVYNVKTNAVFYFYLINSLIVFAFLICYTSMMMKYIVKSEEKLMHMAHFDNLTDLYNRHYMMENLKSMQKTDSIGWIAMLDIDKFKRVNDVFGHAAGDFILKKISFIMKETCTEHFIARWGGEEFIIIPKDSKADIEILEILRQKVEQEEIFFENKRINITVSIGAAFFDTNSEIEKCIQAADECLYKSKNNGRNQVTI